MVAMQRVALMLSLPLLLTACAAIPIQPGAERIKLTNQEPQGCEYLGEVVGTQGNAVTGSWTSNETLINGARADLKNKALALGGNVVHVLANTAGHTSGQYGGSMSSSHLEGVAYRCPQTVASP